MASQDRFTESIEWYLDHLRAERGASVHTLDGYGRDLLAAADYFSGQGLKGFNEILETHLVGYQTHACRGVKANTARKRISSLRSLLKFLKQNGEGPTADLPSVAGIKLPRRVPKALRTEELGALLDAPDLSTAVGVRDRTLMELIFGTGLRVSEVVGLRMEELDLDSAMFRVTGKGGKSRVVPVPRHTMPWIERYLTEARPKLVKKPSSAVFLGARGGALSRQSIGHIVDTCRRKAGINHFVSPHKLRHTYAVALVRGGADLRVVQELLGHSSISTTQVYTQLDLETVKSNYDKAHPRK